MEIGANASLKAPPIDTMPIKSPYKIEVASDMPINFRDTQRFIVSNYRRVMG